MFYDEKRFEQDQDKTGTVFKGVSRPFCGRIRGNNNKQSWDPERKY